MFIMVSVRALWVSELYYIILKKTYSRTKKARKIEKGGYLDKIVGNMEMVKKKYLPSYFHTFIENVKWAG